MANRIGGFGYMECYAKDKDGVREVLERATRAALQGRRGKKRSKWLLLKDTRDGTFWALPAASLRGAGG